LNKFKKTTIVAYKNPISIVTEADQEAERRILREIRKCFPGHALLTEESPPHETNSPYRWIIDPLDGTTNFSHGLPHACVSVGLEKDGRMLMGGVWDPFKKELFFACRGRGATLNGRPITVSRRKKLIGSLLVTGFPYDRQKNARYYLSFYEKFMVRTQGIRRYGAAALDMCYVACGRFDGFWEFKLNPWDVAAGQLIVEEAGGRLSDFTGRPFDLNRPQQILCTNGCLHAVMATILKKGLRK